MVDMGNLRLPVHSLAEATHHATSPALHDPSTLLQLVATKFSHWRYEHERRMFVQLEEKDAQGLSFCDFSETLALREAIVGRKSTISRAQLKGALGRMSADVVILKARLAFQSFRVVRQKCDALWK